jgi:FaeA-like protein
VGLIAGVTPIIDTHYTVNQVLGERFLLYRMPADPAVTVARRAMGQQGCETIMRQELRKAVSELFLNLVPLRVPIPEAILDRLAHLAAFTARARSGVVWGHGGFIEYVPEPEGPGRLAKQLATLARGLAVVRDTREVTEADYVTIYRVAEDTVPAQRKTMLAPLLSAAEPLETSAIAEKAGYPTESARRYLYELAAMRLVDRHPGGQGRSDRWSLSDLAADLLEKAAPPEKDLITNVVPTLVSN